MGKQLRFSKLVEYSLQLLIREPTLAKFLGDQTLLRLDGRAQSQILVDMVRWVKRVGEISTTLLLSHYQESSYFDYLKQLAEQDLMLTEDQLKNEFLDTVNKIMAEGDSEQKQKVIDQLATKSLSELTSAERQMLQNYRKG